VVARVKKMRVVTVLMVANEDAHVRGFTGEKEDGVRCGDDGRALRWFPAWRWCVMVAGET